jgi:hypothetical protein
MFEIIGQAAPLRPNSMGSVPQAMKAKREIAMHALGPMGKRIRWP